MELSKRSCVRALVLFQELDDFLDRVLLELIMDQVKVLHPVVPESNLLHRSRVISRLERCLRILFEHILDLSSPCVD